MDIHSDFVEPVTPAVSHNNAHLWKTEDSGYHTSFTPGSVECSEVSNDNLEQSSFGITPDGNVGLVGKHKPKSSWSIHNESSPDSPTKRRGVKRQRPYQDCEEIDRNSLPTPTTMIAGGIQKLKVSDNKSIQRNSVSSVISEYSNSFGDLNFNVEYARALSFPSTPVKKICRSSCKLSPMKRSAKKLDFAIHSLLCASNSLQKHRPHSKVVRTIQFQPDQKVDIVRMLYNSANAMPPLQKIFSYLSYEDVFNFQLVSHLWWDIWNQVTTSKDKNEYHTCLRNAKKNQENKESGHTLRESESVPKRSLKEVHNILNTHMVQDLPRSPPGTPRTIKFKRFTKSASMDSRLQLLCVRCAQPAKVTKETSGEEWAECTSCTCSYQFCRSCNCDRHPGKSCICYDLDGPSPSKRRRNSCAVGSMKSRRNLRRLL